MRHHFKKHHKSKSHFDIVQHFQTRCLERLGKVLRQKDLKECMDRHTLVYVGRQSCNKTHWEVPHQLLEAWVLTYDHGTGFQDKVDNLREWVEEEEDDEDEA